MSTGVTVRPAESKDGRALMAVIERINHETEFLGLPGERMPWADRADAVLQEMAEAGRSVYLLALRGPAPIGFLGAFGGPFARSRGNLFIGHVGLIERERGLGAGRTLFEAVERWARERGCRRLELRVDERNARGQALYRARGFAIEGRIEQAAMQSDGLHAHLSMAKPLTEPRASAWAPVELAPPAPAFDAGRLVFRDLALADAQPMVDWERQLMADLPVWLKQPGEVSDAVKTAHWIGEGIKYGSLLHVAALGARIVGYVGVNRQPGGRMRHDAFVTLGVLREAWGAGIGRGLMTRVLDWAKAERIGRLSAASMAHNARGLRFAERHGFRREVHSPGYTEIDGQRADRVQLGRLLG
jgi:RimJ/RimL family protein N-acetyltransferase